jgi:hypothetical protein
MKIDLLIGGYNIRLDEPEGHACASWPFAPFAPFIVTPNHTPDITMTVRVVSRLPTIPHGPLLYDACHGLWTWHAAESRYLLKSPNRSNGGPEALALVSEDIASADVWVIEEPVPGTTQMGWTPLHIINPIVETCLLTRLARDGGLLLHASGLLMEQGGPAEPFGMAFTGASGAGKSTLSAHYAARGAHVLSDERIILRTVEGTIQVFGTPWPGSGTHARNECGPLAGLFCIHHGQDGHTLRRMPPGAAASFILPQCFLPHWDRAAMNGTLAFLSALVVTVGCFDLAFMNRPDIVEFIMEQHMERALTTP